MSSHDDYQSAPGVRWSHLKHMQDSPAHYRAAIEAPHHETPALVFGRLVHTLVLEPDTFHDGYAVWDGGRRAGKAWTEFQDANAGRTLVKADEYTEAEAIAASVRAHPVMASLLDGGWFELPAFWTDDETGLECKALIDLYHPATGTLLDLKTARTTCPRRFASQAASLGYHGQLAHYKAGLEANGCPVRRVLICAVEKVPPYDCVVYDLTDTGALDIGATLRRDLLARVAECEASGQWPGRSSGIEPLTLPQWADPDSSDIDFDLLED